MTIGIAVLLSVDFAPFSTNALHWYNRFQTYPLFAWVGKAGFRRFHGEYEHRRLDRAAPHQARKGLDRLVRLNAPRLVASTASSAVVPVLLARVLDT